MVITIDGPASSGKSTVGLLFAQKIGYQFVDSGLIYRIATLLALQAQIDLNDEGKCAQLLKSAKIDFKTTDLLKTPEVDKAVSVVAALPKLREEAKKIQRQIGLSQNTVIAGRDIGSEIFPESPLKFFITASVEARAKRRYDQQIKLHPEIKYEDIAEDIRKRDEQDANRKASPMRVPEDAIIVDTSDKNIDQVVEELVKIYTDKNLLQPG